MFLVGVFLTDATPADPAPARLDFTSNDNFTSLTPLLGQTFFIGDGLTGTGVGARQQFTIPAAATRLFLGFADASFLRGNPGAYSDNAGSLTAAFQITGGAPAAPAPVISQGGVVNGADFTAQFAPGIIFSIWGTNLASQTTAARGVPLPQTLDGVSVEILDGAKVLTAPLFFVSPGQINGQLPFEVAGATVQVRVRTAGGQSNTQTIPILPRCPKLLTKTMDGRGEAIITHANFTLVAADSPAAPDETVILYLTGLGAVSPAAPSGQAAGLHHVRDEVIVTVDGLSATVDFAGLAPGWVGLYQINFKVPAETTGVMPEIRVLTGRQQSQADVAFAAGSLAWQAAATVPSGPEGGTITAGQFSLSVAAGAFAARSEITAYRIAGKTSLDAHRISDVYALGGLPAAAAAPQTLTFDLPGASPVPGETYLVLQRLGQDVGEALLKASVEGSRVTVTLPAYQGGRLPAEAGPPAARAASASREADFWRLPQIVCFLIGRYTERLSRDGHFKLVYATNIVPDVFGDALEDAWTALVTDLGFTPARFPKTPIAVPIRPVLSGERWGNPMYHPATLLGVEQGYALWLDSTYMIDAARIEEAKRKAAHTLFHLITFTHPTGKASWLWLDEAAATWFEQYMFMYWGGWVDRLPELALENLDFLTRNGLEYPARRLSQTSERKHGYGAYFFIEHVITQAVPPGFLATLYPAAVIAAPDTYFYALDGLQAAGLDVTARWLAFCREFAEQDPLSRTPSPAWQARILALASSNTATLTQSSPSRSFAWDSSPNLSARFYRVGFSGVFRSEQDRDKKLNLKLSSTASAVRAVVRRVAAGGQIGASLGEVLANASAPLSLAARGNFDQDGE